MAITSAFFNFLKKRNFTWSSVIKGASFNATRSYWDKILLKFIVFYFLTKMLLRKRKNSFFCSCKTVGISKFTYFRQIQPRNYLNLENYLIWTLSNFYVLHWLLFYEQLSILFLFYIISIPSNSSWKSYLEDIYSKNWSFYL